MTIERVDIVGVRADIDFIGFDLGWRDDAGNYGEIKFLQDFNIGGVYVDSEHNGKAFVIEVLRALEDNLELNDK